MNSKVTIRLLALPILWMGFIQVFYSILSLSVFKDNVIGSFLMPGMGLMIIGGALFYRYRNVDVSTATFKDALVYASSTWVIAGLAGSLPIMSVAQLSFTDASFESISALTTTGATVLTDIDSLPPTFLLYRQFLQWVGGLGIVIFVVAVLPMLNVGGMKLLKAETPGPVKDEKLSPRIAHTAHYLWVVYITITVLCALAYKLGGMTAYDAIAHSFTTVSTGGFSTHNASMWYYESYTLLWICNFFMVVGAVNFGLHFRVVQKGNFKGYYHDEETRIFLAIVAGLSLVMMLLLYFADTYSSMYDSFSFATFHIISFITSTGYGAASYTEWGPAATFFLVFTGYLGGCAGSTAGGNKIIRNIITAKVINKNLKQLVHPRAVLTIKYQGAPVKEDVRHAVMAFMSFAAGSSLLFTLLLMATGLDFWSAFSAVAACVNVLGPGFGEVGSNFTPVSDLGTWILSGAMILGRLEYFTIFALITPTFWNK